MLLSRLYKTRVNVELLLVRVLDCSQVLAITHERLFVIKFIRNRFKPKLVEVIHSFFPKSNKFLEVFFLKLPVVSHANIGANSPLVFQNLDYVHAFACVF